MGGSVLMKNICCFAGHSKLSYGDDVKNQVFNKCYELIIDFCVNEFWVGNYGSFDRLAANVVRRLKRQHYKYYDNIIMAQIPDGTPKRYQILKCNQYMVDKSKYLIAFVNSSFGGAAKTMEYAKRKRNIEVFNFGQ